MLILLSPGFLTDLGKGFIEYFLKAIQKNIHSLFTIIPKNINKIDLRTEYDSYEYLIWVNSKIYFNNKFYIGSSEKVGYKSYSKNLKDTNFYSLQISYKNKYWSYKFTN